MCFFSHRVPPFGYPRIVVYLRLPEAFRSLLRPSSALYAKAFTVRPFSFNHPCHQIEIFDGLFFIFQELLFYNLSFLSLARSRNLLLVYNFVRKDF